jgi:hypothetical protein
MRILSEAGVTFFNILQDESPIFLEAFGGAGFYFIYFTCIKVIVRSIRPNLIQGRTSNPDKSRMIKRSVYILHGTNQDVLFFFDYRLGTNMRA